MFTYVGLGGCDLRCTVGGEGWSLCSVVVGADLLTSSALRARNWPGTNRREGARPLELEEVVVAIVLLPEEVGGARFLLCGGGGSFST